MIQSIRMRLTLWHTTMLAVLLGLFAAGAYAFVVRSTRARTDAAVVGAVADFRTALVAERLQQPTTPDAAREVLRELRVRTTAFMVFDATGVVVGAIVPRPRVTPTEDAEPPLDAARVGRIARGLRATSTRVVTVPDPEGGYRAAIAPVHMRDGEYTVAAATSLHDEEETLAAARLAMRIAIPAALLLSALGGWWLARRSLQPMVTMRDQASRIGANSLGARLPVANPGDEVGRLAAVFNEMLTRLERAFTQQRQFMADASHELRTPVAVVQHEASLALSRPDRPSAEYRDALTVVRDAGRRLRRVVDDLFLLARADAGELPVRRAPFYLDELLVECVHEVRTLALARGSTVLYDPHREAPFTGDEALLHRLVLNLLDNAIKFSPAGGTIALRLVSDARTHRVEVEDTGPGIPAELQPHVFERLVRADPARTRDEEQVSGAGLGLAIARWVAEAHGGTLELERSSKTGSLFVLSLPIGTG